MGTEFFLVCDRCKVMLLVDGNLGALNRFAYKHIEHNFTGLRWVKRIPNPSAIRRYTLIEEES